VFLSYASQDAAAARRICEALRTAAIEVWFDQSELRGGDAWDQSIRKQIKTCALFLPIISKHTHERAEGYFRLEWKLAVDRSHLIMANKAFLVPVVIDGTADDDENVPEKFREVQWTRLLGGVASPEFVVRVKGLLSPEPLISVRLPAGAASDSSPTPLTTGRPSPLRRALPVAVAVLLLAGVAYLLINKPWISKPAAPPATSSARSSPGAPSAAFNPPPHSIAVLPFVNMSGDKDQEYFSDGLTEEILNSLSRIKELQVAGRTSSFYFKGKDVDLGTVAHKLNVAGVLEGSVRRSGDRVRVTTQLIDSVTGFHLWSETYDRDLGDVLQLETEIASAVAGSLKVSLLEGVSARIELGGTRNPAARDAYLRATKAYWTIHDFATDVPAAITAYSEAIRLDPNYALAFAGRSIALFNYTNVLKGPAKRETLDKGLADARQAITLAPDLADGHLALASFFESSLDFEQATTEYERALALAPGNARVLRDYGYFAVLMGRADPGIAAVRRSTVLDPLNAFGGVLVGAALFHARRYEEALTVFQDVITLDPDTGEGYWERGRVYYALGDLQNAHYSCEIKSGEWTEACLAMVYDKLGRHADAQGALAKLQASRGDAAAYQYAEIYAQWGITSKALEWAETALRLRDPDLEELKVDPLLAPIRKESRFQAIERELKFPD
jgi:TolB-like protein/cytochrome c-type biogenesis protein CcmH/NrfG